MKDIYPLVITRQYQQEAEKWLKALKRGENVSVIFFPQTDRLRRLQQLLEDQDFLRSVFGKEARYLFQIIDLSAHIIEDIHELYEHIAEQLNLLRLSDARLSFDQWLAYLRKYSINAVLILPQAEKYLIKEERSSLTHLSYLADKLNPTFTVMSLYEKDITHPSLITELPSRLYQNIYFYPLYDADNALRFIRYLVKKWNFACSRKKEQEILAACGGHFWFIKEAVRQLATSDSELFKHESMSLRLRTVYDLMLPSEKSVLNKIITRKKDYTTDEQHSLSYFKKMNFVNSQNRLLVNLYQDFILQRKNVSSEIEIHDNHIILNKIPVDKFFSKKEYRALRVLIENKGMLVSRDTMAKAIWPSDTVEHFSDWAIDQIIARLRNSMQELALSPTLIKTIRGKGYSFSL